MKLSKNNWNFDIKTLSVQTRALTISNQLVGRQRRWRRIRPGLGLAKEQKFRPKERWIIQKSTGGRKRREIESKGRHAKGCGG